MQLKAVYRHLQAFQVKVQVRSYLGKHWFTSVVFISPEDHKHRNKNVNVAFEDICPEL